jgi:hypothetical protein
MNLKAIALMVTLALAPPSIAGAAILPPGFLDSVVALGTDHCTIDPTQPPSCAWFTEGTGFIYGYLAKDDTDPAKKQYWLFLVTARHVVDEHQGEMRARFNPSLSSTPGAEFTIAPQAAAGPWFFSDTNTDVAVTLIDPQVLKDKGIKFSVLESDLHAASTSKMRDIELSAGDGAFVLGFPMNLAGVQRNYVIVRQGAIARISELFDGAATNFLLDAFVFPGNSGGPVFSRPEFLSITGTKNQSTSYLIGMVVSYQEYTDVAVSIQTKRPRVTFEENSGLAVVVPVDYIDATIKEFLAEKHLVIEQSPAPRPKP